MDIEPVYGIVYRIALTAEECSEKNLPRVINELSDELDADINEISAAERLSRRGGGCVIYLKPGRAAPRTECGVFAADICGSEALGGWCRALVGAGLHLSGDIRVYSGRNGCYRAVLRDPSPRAEYICREFGDFSEITELFAAKSAEQLCEAARGAEIERLAEIL